MDTNKVFGKIKTSECDRGKDEKEKMRTSEMDFIWTEKSMGKYAIECEKRNSKRSVMPCYV